MELHEELRRLTETLGTTVLDDPDNFRAAVDDFLDEDAATRGQVHLLVDTIRLGAYARLMAQLDGGASPEEATADSGHWLARERGTSDEDGSRWACAVLGYAAGRFDSLPTGTGHGTLPMPTPDTDDETVVDGRVVADDRVVIDDGTVTDGGTGSGGEPILRRQEVTQDRWLSLVSGAVSVGAILATVLPFWSTSEGDRNGWTYTSWTVTDREPIWPWLAIVVVVFAAVLLLVSSWRLMRGPNLRTEAVGLVGSTGLVTAGVLMALSTESVLSADLDTTIGVGLWMVWVSSLLALALTGVYVRRLLRQLAVQPTRVASDLLLCLLLVAVAVLALVAPWLTWYEFPLLTVDGWGNREAVDPEARQQLEAEGRDDERSARAGVLLQVVAAINLALALRLLRPKRLTGRWIVPGVVSSTVGMAVALFAIGPRIHVAIRAGVVRSDVRDPARAFSFGWGAWWLLLLGALCLLTAVLLLWSRPEPEPPPNALGLTSDPTVLA